MSRLELPSIAALQRRRWRPAALGALAACRLRPAPAAFSPAPAAGYVIVEGTSLSSIVGLTKTEYLDADSNPIRWQPCADACMARSWCYWFIHRPWG